ncbi:hypothetical protein CWI37_0938p0020 [Hamiltosporidium tvaerminnensis]|uniref:Uncharacterized protein n=1 Tax=Hamiltosporidium tvaerminnensis TaxID=1176355 RepID=A0A4Q9L2D3_9MICR|nr:hypothetical protein CWI37_0938p0020 [Hamiltosporidium tvaerminnensis]
MVVSEKSNLKICIFTIQKSFKDLFYHFLYKHPYKLTRSIGHGRIDRIEKPILKCLSKINIYENIRTNVIDK